MFGPYAGLHGLFVSVLAAMIGVSCIGCSAEGQVREPHQKFVAERERSRDLLSDEGGEYDRFLQSVSNRRDLHSIGVLPLVLLEDLKEPRVTRLGISAANQIARAINGQRGPGAMEPGELERELSELGLQTTTMHTYSDVAAAGSRLGVDALIYGTIERVPHGGGGRFGQDTSLRIELRLIDLRGSADLSASPRLPASEPRHAEAFSQVAEHQARWMVGRWPDRVAPPSFQEEIEQVAEAVVRRLARRPPLRGASLGGRTIYIASTHSAALSERERRFDQEEETLYRRGLQWESERPGDGKFEWDGQTFEGPTAPRDAIEALRTQRREWRRRQDALGAEEITVMIAARVRAQYPETTVLTSRDLAVKDGDAVQLSLVRPAGGEPRDFRSLRQYQATFVLLPRLDNLASGDVALRLEVHDAEEPSLFQIASSEVIARRHVTRLAASVSGRPQSQ